MDRANLNTKDINLEKYIEDSTCRTSKRVLELDQLHCSGYDFTSQMRKREQELENGRICAIGDW